MVKIFLEFSEFGCEYLRVWELVDLIGINFAWTICQRSGIIRS
jgi:hypothetical protein